MEHNYVTPLIEVIEIEVEDVLCQSGEVCLSGTQDGGNAW